MAAPLVLRPDGAKLRVPCFVPLVGVFLAGAFFVVVAGWLSESLGVNSEGLGRNPTSGHLSDPFSWVVRFQQHRRLLHLHLPPTVIEQE